MVAEVEALDDSTDEPRRCSVEHRDSTVALGPIALFELVDLVTGLAAEQVDDIHPLAPEQMHRDVAGGRGDAPRPVRFRDRDEEARRVDARLSGETDHTSGPFTGSRCRDHVERRVSAV